MRLTLVLAGLVMTACTAMPHGPFPPVDAPDACGASGLQSLIGKPEAMIYATTFVGPIRVIRLGQPVTEEYSAERANFWLDARGRIKSVTCG